MFGHPITSIRKNRESSELTFSSALRSRPSSPGGAAAQLLAAPDLARAPETGAALGRIRRCAEHGGGEVVRRIGEPKRMSLFGCCFGGFGRLENPEVLRGFSGAKYMPMSVELWILRVVQFRPLGRLVLAPIGSAADVWTVRTCYNHYIGVRIEIL